MDLLELNKALNSRDLIYLNKVFGQSRKSWFQNIFLYITEKCQLYCKHCYLGERLRRGSEMPLDQIITHLTLWKNLGTKKICFVGGEPVLHPQFRKVIQYANTLGYEKVVLDTNGTPPALDTLTNFNSSDFNYIQVSLDGASSETHDRIRGEGTYKMTLNTIKELCNQGFDVRIICTVNKFNIKDCIHLPAIAYDIGVSLVKFHIFSEEGRGKENPQLALTPHEWIEFIESLSVLDKKNQMQVLFQPTYSRKEKGYRYFKEGYTGCIGRKLDRISIFPDGKMYVCSYLFDTDLNFAEMKNGQIKLNRKINELNLFYDQDNKCNNCGFSRTCFGICPAEKIVAGSLTCDKYSDIFPICRLWKSTL